MFDIFFGKMHFLKRITKFLFCKVGQYNFGTTLSRARIKGMVSLWQGIQQYELYNKYPELFKRLEQVEAEVAGGTTAVIALVRGPQLYIANVGQSTSIFLSSYIAWGNNLLLLFYRTVVVQCCGTVSFFHCT